MRKFRAEDNHLFRMIDPSKEPSQEPRTEPIIYYEIVTKSGTMSNTGDMDNVLHEIKVAVQIWKEVRVYAKEYQH